MKLSYFLSIQAISAAAVPIVLSVDVPWGGDEDS